MNITCAERVQIRAKKKLKINIELKMFFSDFYQFDQQILKNKRLNVFVLYIYIYI